MFLTTIIVSIFLAMVIFDFVSLGVLLRIGLWWAKVANATIRQLFVAVLTIKVNQLVLAGALQVAKPTSDSLALLLLLDVMALAIVVLIGCVVIARVFKASFTQSLQAWLPALFLSVGLSLASSFVVRTFVCESFMIQANAMAPTILGNTRRSTCPDCGRVSYCSLADPMFETPDSLQMICQNFHVSEVSDVQEFAFPQDRVLVMKCFAPRRWDVVAFKSPDDPSRTNIMRLVGLPGETIHIEEGAVWANGNKLELPKRLSGIEYLCDLPKQRWNLWGSKNNPAVLGPDEYFVLGDFSAKSFDSRYWEQGAPEHNPFAVPESHLLGVVTNIFWPPNRWQVLR